MTKVARLLALAMACGLLLTIAPALLGQARQPEVRLVLGTVNGKRQFHIGEPVPVTLDFSTSVQLGIVPFVRLRMYREQENDEFSVTPSDGAVDPLGAFPWSSRYVPLGLNDAPAEFNSSHPLRIERDLNEFVVFRKPGRYRVTVRSTRVTPWLQARPDGSPPAPGTPVPPVNSNSLELEILPRDEAWCAAQLAAAVSILKEPIPAPDTPGYWRAVDAIRSLRYLETEAATRALAAVLGHYDDPWHEVLMGLWSTPYRDAALETLRSLLFLPDTQLNPALEDLRALESAGHGGALSPAEAETWGRRETQFNLALVEAAKRKPEPLRSESLYTLWSRARYQDPAREVARQALLACAPSFTSALWRSVLSSQPPADPSGQLVPVMKRILTESGSGLDGEALRSIFNRIAWIDGEFARNNVQMRLLADRFDAPDEALFSQDVPPSAELDRALLQQLESEPRVEARIAHFASKAAKPELLKAYNRQLTLAESLHRPLCFTPLLSYFFRVDPKLANTLTTRMRATAGQEPPACQWTLPQGSAMSPALEARMAEDVASAPGNAKQMLITRLQNEGGETARRGLWSVLRAMPDSAGGPRGSQEDSLRTALIQALWAGANWVATPQEMDELLRLAPESNPGPIGQLSSERKWVLSPVHLSVSPTDPRYCSWSGLSAAEATIESTCRRLTYVPPGTKVLFSSRGVDPATAARVREPLRAACQAQGLVFENDAQ